MDRVPAPDTSPHLTKFGGWVALPTLISVEALARAGMDFVTLDLQHGALDFHDAAAAIQLLDALGVESLVRVAAAELPSVSRFLDFGVSGVIVAVVESAASAAAAIDAARYQPDGIRSYGGQRYGLRAEPSKVRSIKPAIYAMIETAGGVDELDAIAATPGLAGLFVGPMDLALALGERPWATAGLASAGRYVARRSGRDRATALCQRRHARPHRTDRGRRHARPDCPPRL